jgi:hypothetical protein
MTEKREKITAPLTDQVKALVHQVTVVLVDQCKALPKQVTAASEDQTTTVYFVGQAAARMHQIMTTSLDQIDVQKRDRFRLCHEKGGIWKLNTRD